MPKQYSAYCLNGTLPIGWTNAQTDPNYCHNNTQLTAQTINIQPPAKHSHILLLEQRRIPPIATFLPYYCEETVFNTKIISISIHYQTAHLYLPNSNMLRIAKRSIHIIAKTVLNNCQHKTVTSLLLKQHPDYYQNSIYTN